MLDWPGTLLLVSHDRRFLDNVVTSTIAFEGDGKVVEYVGGYEDWLRQREPPPVAKAVAAAAAVVAPVTAEARKRKLTYSEQRELGALPERIAALESEQQELQTRSAGAEFYLEGGEAIRAVLKRLEEITIELNTAYARWDELDSTAR